MRPCECFESWNTLCSVSTLAVYLICVCSQDTVVNHANEFIVQMKAVLGTYLDVIVQRYGTPQDTVSYIACFMLLEKDCFGCRDVNPILTFYWIKFWETLPFTLTGHHGSRLSRALTRGDDVAIGATEVKNSWKRLTRSIIRLTLDLKRGRCW